MLRAALGSRLRLPHLEAIDAGEDALSLDHVLLGAGQLEASPGVYLLLGGLWRDLVPHPVGLHRCQLVGYHLPCASRKGKLRHGGPAHVLPLHGDGAGAGRAQPGAEGCLPS